jgi:tight adherence protein B
MSAWVLGLLPITIGLLIGVLNANYVASMWFDATGRKLMLGALALQIFGAISLYRLARLK